MRKEFRIQLQMRKAKGIKKKATIPPKWLFPKNQEKQYDKILYSLVKDLKWLIKEYLIPAIPEMVKEVESKMPNDRQDQFLDRLNSVILFIRKTLQPNLEFTIAEAERIAFEISIYNKRQFQKMNESAFGIDIFVDEPWLSDQLKLFASQNSQLITSLPDDELNRVGGIIERGLQQGERIENIAQDIQKSFGISDRRATLIARDQTTKLNASLTRLRQQEVGVEEYIWQTSGDERVRPTHRENDGKKFSWDKPPAKTGHPGNDVNCRCIARPVLDKLLNL